MNGTSHHLTLEELTGDIDLSDAARTHLAACADCAAEAQDWAAVASAARLITSGTRISPALLGNLLSELGDSRPANRKSLRSRALLPYAAAAAIVLSGGGYGLTTALNWPGTSTSTSARTTATGLTATGCTSLDLAAGTLSKVTGHGFILTPANGHPVTVTTSAQTTFLRVEAGSLSDIADGEHVLVSGSTSGGTLKAAAITVTPSTVAGPVRVPGSGAGQIGIVTGTVTDAGPGGFTVVASGGQRHDVTTSSATVVIDTARSSLSQLRPGETTTATGHAAADGTLAASTVEQLGVPGATWHKVRPAVPAPKGLPPGLHIHIPAPAAPAVGGLKLNGLGCAPSAVTTAYLLTAAY